jgi:uncharacterized protein DUF481
LDGIAVFRQNLSGPGREDRNELGPNPPKGETQIRFTLNLALQNPNERQFMTEFQHSISRLRRRSIALFLATFAAALPALSQATPAADELVLSNGDTLHGKFVSSIGGKVTFHSDPLGDVTLTWDKIKELHTNGKFAVVDDAAKLRKKSDVAQIPVGVIEASNGVITVQKEGAAAGAPIPVKNAQFVVDQATLDKQLHHSPGFFSGWNGAATGGASIVTSTQNQFTVTGDIALARVVPTAPWLDPRNRTLVDFKESYGRITQPAYTIPPTTPGGTPTVVAETITKSAITHADAERDQYFSPRFFALGQTAFDHNFGQNLQLQQIYGGGLGWTVLKTPNQEADLKATMQYERQQFIGSSDGLNLIGSTFSADYVLHLKLVTYTQSLAFIPAYNDEAAYSANETNLLAFPAYKNLSFSLGTTDSYLNDPPVSLPPTQRNSFQFTMGLTYAIKSKY